MYWSCSPCSGCLGFFHFAGISATTTITPVLQVLSFLDFFPTGVQRTAVATAANMCRALTAENADAVATAAPILIGLLQYQVGTVTELGGSTSAAPQGGHVGSCC